jgi:hypothetical protein
MTLDPHAPTEPLTLAEIAEERSAMDTPHTAYRALLLETMAALDDEYMGLFWQLPNGIAQLREEAVAKLYVDGLCKVTHCDFGEQERNEKTPS